jgi:hypothetical protein
MGFLAGALTTCEPQGDSETENERIVVNALNGLTLRRLILLAGMARVLLIRRDTEVARPEEREQVGASVKHAQLGLLEALKGRLPESGQSRRGDSSPIGNTVDSGVQPAPAEPKK